MKVRLNDLIVDMHRRQVMRGGDPVHLPDLSWRVLAALIEHAPETAGYDALAKAAWRQDNVSPDTMTQRIKLLRQALDDNPGAPAYVATDRGVGYRLVTPVEVINEKSSFLDKRTWALAAGACFLTLGIVVFIVTRTALAPINTPDPTISVVVSANDLVDRGFEYMARGSKDDNERALLLFDQAMVKDSNNLRGIIGQSFAHSHRATKFDYDTQSSRTAEDLARRALEIDAKAGKAWHALGFALDAQGRVGDALRAYEQAIAIDTNDSNAKSSAAYLLQIQGRFHEALLLEREILQQKKPSKFTFLQVASTLRLAGFDDAALAWLSRAETLTPDNILLTNLQAEFMLSSGDYADAERVSAPSAGDRRASLDVLYGEALLARGEITGALAAFEEAIRRDKNSANGTFQKAAVEILAFEKETTVEKHPLIASWRKDRNAGDQWPELSVAASFLFASGGDIEGVVTLLTDAHKLGYRDANRLHWSPFFKNVQSDPKFQKILQAMKEDVVTQRLLIENDPRLSNILWQGSN